ncbi:SPOR domain-containing protein [Thorsellia kenyensis]|uniref:SPOR domain-containing protein n=1 Tax=Thorsellia kenyensis TaxID=1549888 RepID=A0ABV6CE11_9GAMM
MAQRDYISSKNRPARNENRRNAPVAHRQTRGKSPYILIAIILLILMVFVGVLYYIMNNAPAEEVAQQMAQSTESVPPPPLDKWQYINDLESGSRPVDDSILDASSLEQEALNALIAQQIDPTTGEIIANPTPNQINPTEGTLGTQLDNATTALPPLGEPQLPNNGIYSQNPNDLVQPSYNEPSNQSIGNSNNSAINALENELASLPSNGAVQSSTNVMPSDNNLSSGSLNQPNQVSDQEALEQQRKLAQEQARKAEEQAILKQKAAQEQARLKQKADEEKAKKERLLAEQQARREREEAAKRAEEAKVIAQQKVEQTRNVPVSTTGSGWQLQCGSFADVTKAESLKALLAFKGIPARVVKAGQYNRVMVGPYSSRQDANSLLPRTQAAGVPGCIILAP